MREPMTWRSRIENWLAHRRGLTRAEQLKCWYDKPLEGKDQITPIVFGAKSKAHEKLKLLRRA